MLNIKIKYVAIFLFAMAVGGCQKPTDKIEQPDNGKGLVHLAITTRAAHIDGKESINKDNDDFEDHVHSLAMLVFDHATGEKVAQYYTENFSGGDKSFAFLSQMTPGQRDFYFVANLLPDMKEAFKAVSSRSEMEAQMKSFREFPDGSTSPAYADLYLGASDRKGFPMARVYTNQTITKGGTAYRPQPFHPVDKTTKEDCVKLVRVVAKLEVIFEADDAEYVAKVELGNASRKFAFTPQSVPTTEYKSDIEMKRVDGKNSWIAYMPAAYVEASKTWNTLTSSDHKPINFFRITDTRGKSYEIPIITHSGAIPGGTYLPFAQGKIIATSKPEYTIYRNHHYKYEIKNLPNQIEIFYSITHWNVVNKQLYMGYGFAVEAGDDGKGHITNTIHNCTPHKVTLEASNGAYFDDNVHKTTVEFEELTDGATVSFKINKDLVGAGQVYMKVYYNKGTFSASVKEFSKK